MAVLQKIRNKGPLLVTILGIALLLFILQIAFEAMGPAQNAKSQYAGEVYGENIMIQDYQQLVEDWKIYAELTNPNITFAENELNEIQDMAWNNYVQSSIVVEECSKLGLAVTEEEVLDIIKSGNSPLLNLPIFANPETGIYDYSVLQNFLQIYNDAKKQGQQLPDEYEKIYKYYTFVKKNIKQEILANKYQGLLYNSILSNQVEAQMTFDSRTNESDIILASIPYSSVEEKDITINDDELAKKYEEKKELFVLDNETRNIKLIDVAIVPSEQDEINLKTEMDSVRTLLANATNNSEAGNIVRNNSSKTIYTNILKTKNAYPAIFTDLLDSLVIGETSQPAYDAMTNTFYVIKMLDKATEADSVLYRSIAIAGKDKEDTRTKVDSVMNALNAGTNFKELAEKYNQTGDSLWMTSNMYQNSMLGTDDVNFVKTIFTSNVGETTEFNASNGATMIIQVLDKKNPVTKYNVASIVKELLVSDETRTQEYNKFSSFLAANNTIELIEENAPKSNYHVQTINNVRSDAHNVNNIPSTSGVLRWIFDEAEVGDISKLEEGGDNHLLVAYLAKINDNGFTELETVKDYITNQVKTDKKADLVISKLDGVNTIEQFASKFDASIDTIKHVSFASPTFVSATSANETLIGAISANTKVGEVSSPIKGNMGVYMIKVLSNGKTSDEFNSSDEQKSLSNQYFQIAINGLLRDLRNNAEVKDLRYKFY